MKKILLSLILVTTFVVAKSQVVINEVYTDPGSGNSEFFELYNSGPAENLNCYTLVVLFSEGGVTGWYVLDFPSQVVANQDFYVGAAADPFNVQQQTNVDADLNWNSFPDATGSLKFYERSGGGYLAPVSVPANFNDLFHPKSGAGDLYAVYLFKDGVLINGFLGGAGDGDADAVIKGMPVLNVDMDAACSDFSITWATIPLVEHSGEAAGNDNGYAREFDGKCGSWNKTSSSVNHTPGAPNGSAAGETGEITTSQFITCVGDQSPFPYAAAHFDITAISGVVTLADDFPVNLQLYRDVNDNGVLDLPDTIIRIKAIATVAASGDSIWFVADNEGSEDLIFAYRTKRGCFDVVVPVTIACATLPVNLKTFTAARTRSNVTLVWETVTEENNYGFHIQRRIGLGSWVTVGFVPTQAVNGNSFSSLRYEYTENNPTKGITQYRLRQVDIDQKFTYSSIRAVRGEAQKGKTIIYPNPTNDGRVNVVFEDANVIRNIQLMDMSGRMLKQWRNISNNTIEIDNLTPGFYSVRIENTDTGEQTVEKIVVNKR